jgi:NAD(P)-dependent dehydrogenase (short-subunit alcohol dehydrogenase family)
MMSSSPIVLITGANTGLGFETIKALCRSSNAYTILLGGRSIQKAQEAVQLAKSQFPNCPSNLTAIQVNIEDDVSISKSFEEVSTKYGRVDVLINNAGKSRRPLRASRP